MRRLMLEAVRDVERGEEPRGLDPGLHRGLRAHDNILRGDADWRTVFAEDLIAKW